jgi:ABC-type transport system involved in multi-copper enzyme maturation permease subunit
MKVFTIARLTLREALQKRMIWGVLALSLLFLVLYYWGFTLVKADFDATAARRAQSGVGDEGEILGFAFVATILVGLGFYTVNFLAGVMTIFAAVGTIAGEVEAGTFQAIVPKPLRRWELVVGKYLGFALMFVAYILIMSAGILLTARIVADYTPGNILPAIGLIMLVSLILLAVTLLGSTVMQTMANGVVVFMLYGGAMLGGLLETLGSIFSIQSLINIGVVTSLILPSDVTWRRASGLLQPDSNLRFDAPIPIAVSQPPSSAMIIYAVAYVAVLVAGAVLAFQRRDL